MFGARWPLERVAALAFVAVGHVIAGLEIARDGSGVT